MTFPTSNRPQRRSKLLVVPVALLLALLSACGSSNSGSDGPSSGGASSSGGGSSAALEEAATQVAAASSGEAEFPMPTDAFKPGTGTAAVIECAASAPVCVDGAAKAQEAFARAGWTAAPTGDAKFSPVEAGNLIDKAVLDGVDAIVVVALDVTAFKSSVDKALAAGVQIGCAMCTTVGYEGKVFDAAVDFTKQGELMAWSVIDRNQGKGDIVLFEDKGFKQTSLRLEGASKILESKCPDCNFEVEEVSAADLTKPGPPAFTALLSSHPAGTVTDVIAPYDGAGTLFAKTAEQQGRDDLTVSGYDAAPEAIAALTTGKPKYGVTIGEPYEFAAVAAADLAMRAHVGAPTWDAATSLPSVLINKDNAAQYDGHYFEPSPTYLDDFAKLWTQ